MLEFGDTLWYTHIFTINGDSEDITFDILVLFRNHWKTPYCKSIGIHWSIIIPNFNLYIENCLLRSYYTSCSDTPIYSHNHLCMLKLMYPFLSNIYTLSQLCNPTASTTPKAEVRPSSHCGWGFACVSLVMSLFPTISGWWFGTVLLFHILG